jgi:hypothetical protein
LSGVPLYSKSRRVRLIVVSIRWTLISIPVDIDLEFL